MISLRRAQKLAITCLKAGSVAGVLCFLLHAAPAFASDPHGYVYWSDRNSDKIQRSNIAGTVVEDIVTGIPDPTGIFIDGANNHLYWIDNALGSGIYRSNFDGQQQQVISSGHNGGLFDLAVDPVNNYIFYSDLNDKAIYRANRADGSGETLIANLNNGTFWPGGMALDIANQQLYYLDVDSSDTTKSRFVRRVDYDGTDQTLIYTGAVTENFGAIAYDSTNNDLYITDFGEYDIEKYDLDLSSASKVMDTTIGPGGGKSIALDVSNSYIYYGSFGNSATSGVYRANMDGTNEILFYDTDSQTLGVAFYNPELPPGMLGYLSFFLSGLVVWLKKKVSK